MQFCLGFKRVAVDKVVARAAGYRIVSAHAPHHVVARAVNDFALLHNRTVGFNIVVGIVSGNPVAAVAAVNLGTLPAFACIGYRRHTVDPKILAVLLPSPDNRTPGAPGKFKFARFPARLFPAFVGPAALLPVGKPAVGKNKIAARAAFQNIRTAAARNQVSPFAAFNQVPAGTAAQRIVAPAALNMVAAAAARHINHIVKTLFFINTVFQTPVGQITAARFISAVARVVPAHIGLGFRADKARPPVAQNARVVRTLGRLAAQVQPQHSVLPVADADAESLFQRKMADIQIIVHHVIGNVPPRVHPSVFPVCLGFSGQAHAVPHNAARAVCIDNRVAAARSDKVGVFSRAAGQHIVPALARKRVVARAANQQIIAVAARKHIVAVRANHDLRFVRIQGGGRRSNAVCGQRPLLPAAPAHRLPRKAVGGEYLFYPGFGVFVGFAVFY